MNALMRTVEGYAQALHSIGFGPLDNGDLLGELAKANAAKAGLFNRASDARGMRF